MKVDAAFAEQLGASDRGWLASAAVVYGLDRELRVAAVNDAWSAFAERNGGGAALAAGELGRAVLDGTRGPIASFYERAFRGVIDAGRPFEHVLECSSAEVLRICRMVARRLEGGGGMLVATSVSIERPHRSTSRAVRMLDANVHLDAGGVWTECGSCRRVQRRDDGSRWDWVPDLLGRDLSETRFALCPSCTELY